MNYVLVKKTNMMNSFIMLQKWFEHLAFSYEIRQGTRCKDNSRLKGLEKINERGIGWNLSILRVDRDL